MTDMIKMVYEATEREVLRANEVHGDLHSRNEGYGVIAEEIDEVMEHIHCIEHYFSSLLRVIRCDLRELGADLKCIKREAQLAACESIQVAAVAQRFIDLINREDHDESLHAGDG